jgi:hypothetical protein
LYLLKSNPEGVPKLLLAHLEHRAAHTNPAADVLVDGLDQASATIKRRA